MRTALVIDRPTTLDQRVLALIDSYPAGTNGTTRDLSLGSTLIAHGGDGNHCVGVTFEVFWRALADCDGGVEAVFDASSAVAFRRQWYVPQVGGRGPAGALPAFGLGTRVEIADARPGDLVQSWTADQSLGHSMVFLGAYRDASGAITKICDWSSQPWTDGIGVSEIPACR